MQIAIAIFPGLTCLDDQRDRLLRGDTVMRALVLYELLSLDGVAEEPSDWLFDDGPEIFDNLGIVISSQDDILLGRGTYDYWADFWPTATVEPFASFINNTMKHVFSSAPIDAEWSNTTVVSEPAVDYVAALKQGERRRHRHPRQHRAGRLTPGGELVDELRLVVAPTIAGAASGCSATSALRNCDSWRSTAPRRSTPAPLPRWIRRRRGHRALTRTHERLGAQSA